MEIDGELDLEIHPSADTEKLVVKSIGQNSLIINSGCRIQAKIFLRDGAKVEIGSNTIFNGVTYIHAHGGGNVLIGENCLFSQNITFRPSDVHKIYSKNNHNLINPVKDIIIQNNVWVGQDVLFAKGSVIPNGSIVGMGSVVTKPFLTENAIYAGNPAKMVKENVYWEH